MDNCSHRAGRVSRRGVARVPPRHASARHVSGGHSVLVADLLRRMLPDWGPAEFARQLRCTLLSGGTLATILAAPLGVVLIAKTTEQDASGTRAVMLNAIPYAVLLVGAIAASMTIRREVES